MYKVLLLKGLFVVSFDADWCNSESSILYKIKSTDIVWSVSCRSLSGIQEIASCIHPNFAFDKKVIFNQPLFLLLNMSLPIDFSGVVDKRSLIPQSKR